MRIAVLVKQIPVPVEFRMADGRLVRDGLPLEVSAYCRRANAKAVELAGHTGEVVVFTMGPPAAEDALREMIACGATRGVHLCDRAFAGSDTLATASALAAAIRREGPFDLVLAGLNSLDSDTGQVPAQLAEMLGLSFAAGVRELNLHERELTARLETDDGYCTVSGRLPAVLSTAERLCAPSKAPPELREQVDPALITVLRAEDLTVAAERLGAVGSPTSVGPVRVLSMSRRALRAESATHAVELLEELGAFSQDEPEDEAIPHISAPSSAALLAEGHGDTRSVVAEPEVWCYFSGMGVGVELLGEAAELAAWISGEVTAVTTIVEPAEHRRLAEAGADRLMVIPSAREPAQQAEALANAASQRLPWVLLVEGTRSGRVVASMVAARCGWGLVGDAIGVEVGPDGRLVAWKPAFGGRLQVPILSSSPVQMATVRPGVLASRPPRVDAAEPLLETLPAPGPSRLRTVSSHSDDADAGELRRARVVVSVGAGVAPEDYGIIDELRACLGGAALGATRRVTDQGWVPRSRQIGVTGHAVTPRLMVTVGASGRFNHTVGMRAATVILAVNSDPHSEIFEQADVGLVGDWRQIVPELIKELNQRGISDKLAAASR